MTEEKAPANGERKRRRLEIAPQGPDAWQNNFRYGDKGLLATALNAGLVLRNWEPTAGRIALNQLMLEAEHDGETITEGGCFRWRERIEGAWKVAFSSELMVDAIGAVAEEHAYHPVREYLNGLTWDGQERLNRIAPEILDAGTDLLTIRMVRCWHVAAVARIYEPGAQVDSALVLYTRGQGKKKTSFFRDLAGRQWFSAGHIDPADKDTILKAHQAWIVILDEVDELTRRMEWPKLKRWMTEIVDIFRAPYGRRPARYARGFVFGATTNEVECLLDDPSGSRRWWIIEVGERDPDERMAKLAAWRDQIWAEAVHVYRRFKGGDEAERWYLFPEEEHRREQLVAHYRRQGVIDDRVVEFMASRAPNASVRMEDILTHACKVSPDKLTGSKHLERQVGAILRELKWKPSHEGAARTRVWVRA